MKSQIKIEPSILSGDFGRFADEAKRIEESGADAIHLDVMDGHFVPNLTIGPQVVAAINRATDLFLHVHVMIYNPYDYVERFVEAGADRLTFHFEATENVEETLAYIRKCNIEAGLAFCPETSAEFAIKYLTKCDFVLMMTVHPGFGGQKFMPEVLEKIRFLRETIDQLNIRQKGEIVPAEKRESVPPFEIGVDGGINDETARRAVKAGATNLVAGNYLFKEVEEMAAGVKKLRAGGE